MCRNRLTFRQTQIDRKTQADRENRQIDRQIDGQADRQTDRRMDKQTETRIGLVSTSCKEITSDTVKDKQV